MQLYAYARGGNPSPDMLEPGVYLRRQKGLPVAVEIHLNTVGDIQGNDWYLRPPHRIVDPKIDGPTALIVHIGKLRRLLAAIDRQTP